MCLNKLFSLLAAALAVAAKTLPYYCAEGCTEHWSHDEEPELLESWSDAACRVY